MAAVLAQSESELSDCSLLSLLPHTLSSSCPAGAAMSESKEVDSISKFFKSRAQRGSTDLLEQAQMVWKINNPSIPNGQIEEDVESISIERTGEDQIELQGRRDRQRRPGLPGSERGKQVFNFSAKTTTFEYSQMGATGLLKRSNFTESNSERDRESWPVIDYSCLEHISDPVEYFSTYRKLENAEKEVQRLKGESYQTLSKPHGKKDRQRRPGIPEHNRRKSLFKFPGMAAAVVDTSSLSNNSKFTELTNSSCSKAINQTESSEILALESRLVGNTEIHASEGDEETIELEKLMSTCRELDESGIANLVQETLQIKPINVDKLRTPSVSTTTQYDLGSSQICKVAPSIASTSSILKRRFSLINHQDDPFFPPNCNKQNVDGCKQTDDSDKIKFNFKDIYDNDIEHSQGGERDNQIGDSKKLRPNGKDFSDFVVEKMGKESLKSKLPDAEKISRPVDHSSILPNTYLLMDIHGRLAEISNLKRRMLSEKAPESQQLASNVDDSGHSSISKSWEMHSLSPIHYGSYQNAQNSSIPVFLNGRKLEFEDKMQCPIDETMGTDKYISSMNISEDSKSCLNSLLEVDAVQTPDRALNKNEFLSSGSGIILEEVGQASASVNCGPSKSLVNPHQHFGNPGTSADSGFYQLGNPSTAEVNIAIQEDILDVEIAKDDDLTNEIAPLDEGLKISSNLLERTNVNQEHHQASGNTENKKTRRNATSRRKNKRSSLLTRKSLAGAGTAWESGVRKSTRIKMKPLEHWCGERFLYGRVHDSLPTVIGVKKYGTPLQDGKRSMKVKSYVSEKYADLVVQAALY